MAHRKEVLEQEEGVMDHIYNVTYPVGVLSCSNAKDDVMLVQFLVKSYFQDPINAASKPGANLTVNGIFSTSTLVYLKAWAAHFQRVKGVPITIDGKISPCGNISKGSISRQYYKIFLLSWCYRNRCRRAGDETRYFRLDQEASPDVPALLKKAIGPYRGPTG